MSEKPQVKQSVKKFDEGVKIAEEKKQAEDDDFTVVREESRAQKKAR